jgi:superfamily II RNA helicase
LDPDIPDIWQIPRKFDGHATRQLTSPELRQLAGRAGRYGLTSLGVAACCQGGENVEVTSFLGKKYSHVGKTN